MDSFCWWNEDARPLKAWSHKVWIIRTGKKTCDKILNNTCISMFTCTVTLKLSHCNFVSFQKSELVRFFWASPTKSPHYQPFDHMITNKSTWSQLTTTQQCFTEKFDVIDKREHLKFQCKEISNMRHFKSLWFTFTTSVFIRLNRIEVMMDFMNHFMWQEDGHVRTVCPCKC